ncbi:c-type cytochrome [Paenibacillus guangzhouensis]|uniref:c-type cytochrome n=1 Tax=Paenibacillus guangzhouensis TaxID=1473112 RepID=UPI001266C3C2|nr:cytochrome c [Paenibacillus guangzhouensis]
MKAKLTISLILLILLVLPACGPSTNTQVVDSQTIAPEDASAVALYKKSCLSCHAADLSGRVGPSLQEIGTKLSNEQLYTIIHDGTKGMPAFEKALNSEEIDALTQWLSKQK